MRQIDAVLLETLLQLLYHSAQFRSLLSQCANDMQLGHLE
jgi:hypothetical protein